jgi:hypothetical protein
VTIEARALGTGVSAITAGIAHAAPVRPEVLPSEHDDLVKKLACEPFAIPVATGCLGRLGKAATTVALIAKDDSVQRLTIAYIDAIYSKTRKRLYPDLST